MKKHHYLWVCLHGGGGPQVDEVTRLAVVEKWPAFACKLTTPGPGWGCPQVAPNSSNGCSNFPKKLLKSCNKTLKVAQKLL